MSRIINKLYIDDWFGETIINDNKDKVGLLVNITLDEFFKETIALNIISLAKTRKIMAKESDAINHSNYHSVVNNNINILKLV